MALAVALSACGPGAVRATPFDRADTADCQAVAEQWPERVGELEPRVTAVQTSGVAAWGDPPVVARCGKQPPPPTTEVCIEVNGVDWIAELLDDGTSMFTSYGRDPAIEILVPADYESHTMMLPDFTAAAEQVEQTLGECSSVVG